jgi:RHS repeat-associated protein
VLYSYDNIGQLKVADSSDNTEDRGYAYDAAWNLNRRTNNGVTGTFSVDVKNELTNAPAGTGAYDANGNLTNSAGGRYAYTYDDENRLIEWLDNGTGLTPQPLITDFVYDGLGRLRKRLEYHEAFSERPSGDSPGRGWVLDSETHYIYDGNRVIQERDGNNNPRVSYTRAPDLSGIWRGSSAGSESLEGAGGIGGLLARSHGYALGNWTAHNFYHPDGNGNITYLVDSSQGLAASYRYDPFGNTLASSGPLADANVYRFSSKECHVNSGMYYYLYRFYDPSVQRWLTRDPIEEMGGLNLYGFASNSPITQTDPAGLEVLNYGTVDGVPTCWSPLGEKPGARPPTTTTTTTTTTPKPPFTLPPWNYATLPGKGFPIYGNFVDPGSLGLPVTIIVLPPATTSPPTTNRPPATNAPPQTGH